MCAKVSRFGEITTWKLIEASVGCTPCGSNGGCCGGQGYAGSRMVRIAPLGSTEQEARCGPEAPLPVPRSSFHKRFILIIT